MLRVSTIRIAQVCTRVKVSLVFEPLHLYQQYFKQQASTPKTEFSNHEATDGADELFSVVRSFVLCLEAYCLIKSHADEWLLLIAPCCCHGS